MLDTEEVMTLVPHRGKMFLLSRVVEYDIEARTLTAEYDIAETGLFYDPNLRGLPSWASFECMAQSISALSGLSGRAKGEKPKPGVILSVSNLRLKRDVLPAGETLRIRVQEDCRVNATSTFNCEALLAEESAAEAKLAVMEVDDMTAWSEKNPA
jgi:predicted hotdog family 3-hydroxylacyl-ACP dehydratase